MGTRELVEAAARLMDDKMPGWAQNVDLDHLNMELPHLCILGHQPQPGGAVRQHGNYGHAVCVLGLGILMAHPLSLAFGYGNGEDGVPLEACWRHEIALRRLMEASQQPEEVLQCATS